MKITLYRHAEPLVSDNDVISGRDFISWVNKYNESGIKYIEVPDKKEHLVYSSNLARSYETGKLLGKKVIQDSIFREAEIPLLSFPAIHLKAKYWLIIARLLWFLGVRKNCESFFGAKKRAKQIADKIESILQNSGRLVLVGHGFINIFIKKEFLKRNWSVSDKKYGNKYLKKLIIMNPTKRSS